MPPCRAVQASELITTAPDPADGRRRVLALSAEGRRRMPEFKAAWSALADELEAIIVQTAGSDALSSRVVARQARAAKPSRPRPDVELVIRPAAQADRAAILHIARELVRTADTCAYDPDISDDGLWRYWCPTDRGDGFVAEHEGQVVGIFVIRPNQQGPGSHVANASFAVCADVRGLGLGRRMGQAALELAAELGYRAMQFNLVVSTNVRAARLWRSLGFRIVGTVPVGFRLPDGTTVPHHVMYRPLP